MRKAYSGITRRNLLTGAVSGVSLACSGQISNFQRIPLVTPPEPPKNVTPYKLARDENYWERIARFYTPAEGIVNLEHGYWGKMAKPVQNTYLAATKKVNQQNSFYARKDYDADHMLSVRRVAQALGVEDDEIVLTRNASEAIQNLIRQYRGLKKGDAVLYADLDYPSFKDTMAWLETARGVKTIELVLPRRASQQELLDQYVRAFDKHPNLKLMLVTHVSNQHGMVLPLKAIGKEARTRGIDLISDNAQSWGLIDFQLSDFDIDWAGFNLHKWIGSPVGVGALFMKRGSLAKIAPYPGESDPDNNKAHTRVHMATSNFAAFVSVPAALDFHENITSKNKEARLRYLRSLWTNDAETFDHIELLGGSDEASWTGMASFRIRGKNSLEDAHELQQRIEKEFGIFTVVRKGLASGACVRITPQVFNTPEHMKKLVSALKQI